MNFFENYYNNIIKYDLINKFYYKDQKKIPKLKKIILNFSCKNINLKLLISSMIALELITNQKSILTYSKKANITFKIRKGNPTGCKVILRKEKMYDFFFRLISEIIPNFKTFNNFQNNQLNNEINSFSFTITKTLFVYELEYYYQFFKDLPKLQIVIVTNTITSSLEFFYLLKSFKLPVIFKKV